jgi:hypothetical protein
MKARATVTLSNENGLSRSRPCQEPRPTTSDAQRPTYAPWRPRQPDVAFFQPGAGRP